MTHQSVATKRGFTSVNDIPLIVEGLPLGRLLWTLPEKKDQQEAGALKQGPSVGFQHKSGGIHAR